MLRFKKFASSLGVIVLPLILLVMGISESTQAGLLLVEPYLGYSFKGEGDYAVDAGTTSDNQILSYSTPTVGLRLGGELSRFFFGVDGSYQKFTLTEKLRATTSEYDVDKKDVGLFVGYNFEGPLRAWMTYYILKSVDFEDDSQWKAGDGITLAGSYEIIAHTLAVNLEFRSFDYDKRESSGGVETKKDTNMSEILLSLSAPLSFF